MTIEKKVFSYESYSEKTEQERKDEIARNLEFSNEKKKLISRIDRDKKLAHLKSIIERGLIRLSIVARIITGEKLGNDEIREIFEKIEEIDEIQEINKILPEELRVTKENYMRALKDEDFKKEVLKRIDDSLTYIQPTQSGFLDFFSGLVHSIDYSQDDMIKIQENTIDIKESLK
ncbi:MAG: hypothetical protein PHS92_05195 [Candidatus Gracilibacteria bacterium]|nr:hypothetical protein [Candidatus Gracilibacteria bacterium]